VNEKKRVLAAMSGGVDSSVAVALLLENGFQVIGIYLDLLPQISTNKSIDFHHHKAKLLAEEVANQLGIQFSAIDAKEEFRKIVIQLFLESLEQGITLNPCWICNVRVKWNVLFQQMNNFHADYIATGHYARVEKDKDESYHLYTAFDKQKDQSYVLSGLKQAQLRHSIFPLGKILKKEVREKAIHMGLRTAEQPDSQDLCFLGNKTLGQFIKNVKGKEKIKGDIVDISGRILGHHKGLFNYTIGQRKGIRIASSKPYYVIKKDVINNSLVIGYSSELGGNSLIVSQVNWISGKKPQLPISLSLQIRYHSKKVKSVIEREENGSFFINSSVLLRDITPGQIAVFYNNEEVIGSGIIL
jgi:tRNA-specific 2-thiouridylase